MMKNKRLIGFYNYTVVLTYLGFILAFVGITDAINENYTGSMVCLMLAGACDMFDGAVASTRERDTYEKQFGIQIDSLCDLVSFGVLPAVFAYMLAGQGRLICAVASLFVLCGVIRLAFFNVQECERQKETDARRELYVGLPITASALVMPLIYLLYLKMPIDGTRLFCVMLLLLGACFIAGVEIRKPGTRGKIAMAAAGAAELIALIAASGAAV